MDIHCVLSFRYVVESRSKLGNTVHFGTFGHKLSNRTCKELVIGSCNFVQTVLTHRILPISIVPTFIV